MTLTFLYSAHLFIVVIDDEEIRAHEVTFLHGPGVRHQIVGLKKVTAVTALPLNPPVPTVLVLVNEVPYT